MYRTSDWIKALSRLSKLTAEGVVDWKPTSLDVDELPEPSDRLIKAFSADFRDKKYRIFEVKTRSYVDEDEYHWVSLHHLDIFEKTPLTETFITRSSDMPAVADLLRSVERKYAFNAGALDDLLDDGLDEE